MGLPGSAAEAGVLLLSRHSSLRHEQGRAHGDPAPHPAPASLPGPPEEGPRVVFMVDLWHPNVAAAERQALDFIFAPGR